MNTLMDILKNNEYPGRGILLGRSADDKYGVIVYFIMGRSENSRNRIFVDDESYVTALNTREFEPDGPNYTPRISGILYPNGTYVLSILKTLEGDPDCCVRNYFTYDGPKAGTGHFISTYEGNGSPLPSFQGEPRFVKLAGNIDDFTEEVWEALNEDNKVSLFVRYVNLETGAADTRIINKNM